LGFCFSPYPSNHLDDLSWIPLAAKLPVLQFAQHWVKYNFSLTKLEQDDSRKEDAFIIIIIIICGTGV
jgi:hypothetical protein